MALNRRRTVATTAVLSAIVAAPGVCLAQATKELNLPAQSLKDRKRELEAIFRVEIHFSIGASPEGITAPPIVGRYTLPESLQATLEDTSLSYRPVVRGNYRICAIQRCDREREVPEIVVSSARAMNVDIPRSQDGSGPYTIFDRQQLERSSASNIGDFLRMARPGSVPDGAQAGATVISGMGNAFNLRGLPVLVLFDGRRRPAASLSGDEQQPDLLGIATAATERVEVRTGSASAPYGAAAIGGVANVITRRTPGTTLSVRAEQLAGISAKTSQEVWGQQMIDFGGDLRWVSLTGLFSKRDGVEAGDWGTLTRGRELMARHNPTAVASLPIPILGALWNARSKDGVTPLLPGGTSPFMSLPADFRLGDDISALRQLEGTYSSGLAPSAQTFGGGRATYRPSLETRSADVAGKWSFTPSVWVNFEAGYAENTQQGTVSGLDEKIGRVLELPAIPGISPFQTDALIAFNSSAGDARMTREDALIRGAAGLTVQGANGSYVRLDDSWASAEAFVTRPTIVGDAQQIAASILRHFNEAATADDLGITFQLQRSPKFRNTLRETTLGYSGFVASAPVTVALVRLYEEMVAAVAVPQEMNPAATSNEVSSSRRTKEVYSLTGELDLLLHGDKDDPTSHAFSARVAVRGDTFRISRPPPVDGFVGEPIRFHALSGGLSLEFDATASLRLRSHVSTGFSPAPLSSLTLPHTEVVFYPNVVDPMRGGEPVQSFLLTSGGNPDLSPERALSWGAGVVYRAGEKNDLRISIDYSWTRRKDGVLTPAELFFAKGPAYFLEFPGQIARAPAGPGDPYGVGAITGVNTQSQNIAEETVHAVDVAAEWRKPLSVGGILQLSTAVAATPTFIRKTSPSDPSRNDAGWGGTSPARYVVGTSLMYERGAFLAGITTRLIPEYEVSRDHDTVLSQGARTVKARSFSDLVMSYRFTLPSGDLDVRFDARNVFRERPAVDIAAPDFVSPYSRGELPSYSLSVRKTF